MLRVFMRCSFLYAGVFSTNVDHFCLVKARSTLFVLLFYICLYVDYCGTMQLVFITLQLRVLFPPVARYIRYSFIS